MATRPHGEGSGPWSVGELAAAAGVTVRTLHHYDRVGLVPPSGRTGAGHRRYTGADVRRLYRVLALRHLGFGLDRIRDALRVDDPGALRATVCEQLAQVDDELRGLHRLRARLARLVTTLDHEPGAEGDVLTTLMEAIDMTVHLARIYTRTGDDGHTSLGDGPRIAKPSAAVEALGDLEELGAQIGLTLVSAPVPHPYAGWLRLVQNDLFDAGADFSGRVTGDEPPALLDQSYVDRLERHCDTANEALAPLHSFTLPGGAPTSAHLHVCRTVCRRAERHVLAVDGTSPYVGRYLNRLGDLLFILARAVDARPAVHWEPGKGRAGD